MLIDVKLAKWKTCFFDISNPTTPSVSCTWEARSGEPPTKVWWDLMLPILEGLQPVGFSSWGRKTCITRKTPPPPTFWHFFGPIAHGLDFRVGRVIHSLVQRIRRDVQQTETKNHLPEMVVRPSSFTRFQSIWKTWIKLQKSSPNCRITKKMLKPT